jgi:hypothetical protein
MIHTLGTIFGNIEENQATEHQTANLLLSFSVETLKVGNFTYTISAGQGTPWRLARAKMRGALPSRARP